MIKGQEKVFVWLPCPICESKTKIKIYEDTVLLNFPLYCTHCKKEFIVGVLKFRMVVNKHYPL